MEIDNEKVNEITLALLYLTTFKDKHGLRAWKSPDRLHEGLHSRPGDLGKFRDADGRRRNGQIVCLRSTS
jgi:hypothetical protein